MGFVHPYEAVEWAEHSRHLAQLHTHEPRNTIRADTNDHEPAIDVERVPIDDLGKNNLSPASRPEVLARKYRNAGYTVFALTEHEYYVDRTKHKDVPYEEMPDVLAETSWPWGDRDGDPTEQPGTEPLDGTEFDPAQRDMLALQGTELRGRFQGTLQDLIGLDTDIGHGRQESMGTLLERIAAQDGIALLPHPSKYRDTVSVGDYRSLFESFDVLRGLEIFNAHDRYPGRTLWDRLLTELGADRPIWAVAGDDYHGRARPSDGKRFDRSRLVLLLPALTREAVSDALRHGRSYVQYNGDAHAPFVESIQVTERAITVDAPAATRIEWIAAGETIKTGDNVEYEHVADEPYVRAAIHGDGDALTCTQPFYVE
ncbi:CehA/McbA family metallohydrolase domain-containing protein [Halorhabdus amylolytica]|uniref:ATP-binding protein n=1 Tax=Halorhabdus amylolytica TaxID=2559573 RepID=UPI0010A9961C|nr:ATP-binding protein [Halorhabdus amylolytica]